MTDLSVIIATYNRAGPLRVCLEALARQTLPADEFEVVVVVDGSTDATGKMLESLTVPYRLAVVSQPNRGQPMAANRGITAASGPYCLFLDDDIQAGPGLLAAHLRAQREQGGILGIGAMPIVLAAGADWFARQYGEIWNEHYRRLDRGRRPTWRDAYGGNLSVPRSKLLELGGFTTDLAAGYDIELSYRLVTSGLALVYLSEAMAHQHESKGGIELAFALQREGEAAVEMCRRHPAALGDLLGGFDRPSARSGLLRRALLTLDVPPRMLAALGPLLPRMDQQRRWGRFVATYSHWRGVRRVTHRSAWRRLLRGASTF